MFDSNTMSEIYLEIIRLIFLVGSTMGIVVGALLIVSPDIVARFSRFSNSWHTPRKQTKHLDVMRDTDPIFYRNHRLTGGIMLFASFLGLYLIFVRFPVNPFDSLALEAEWRFTFNVLLETVKWFFVVFIILGIPVWALLIFDPDRLNRVSHFFNRWISTRNLLRPLEQMNTNFDDLVLRHPRIFGAFFVLGSIFVFVFFWRQ